jgi:hypothetical protein
LLPALASAQPCTSIKAIGDLQKIGNDPKMPLSGNYCLKADIDAKGIAFIPIGVLTPFTGTLDGNNFKINSLTIDTANCCASWSAIGLIGQIGTGGVVRNLGITNELIVVGANVTFASVGGLAGINNGTIDHSFTTGIVSNFGLSGFAGGLVGRNGCADPSCTQTNLTHSFSTANVLGVGRTNNVDGFIGGLVGWNQGKLLQTYATGSVRDVADGGSGVGGLVGLNDGSITQSYARGNVSKTGNGTPFDFNDLGGLVGANQGVIEQSYAVGTVGFDGVATNGGIAAFAGISYFQTVDQTYAIGFVNVSGAPPSSSFGGVGGLIGFDFNSPVTSSYWDPVKTGQQSSPVGIRSTTLKTQLPGGFDTVWAAGSVNPAINFGYPYLLWQTLPPFDVAEATLVLNGNVYSFPPLGQLDPDAYSVGSIALAFSTAPNSWQALLGTLAADRANVNARPYELAGVACLATVYTMLVRSVGTTINDFASMGATVDQLQIQTPGSQQGDALWPPPDPSLSAAVSRITVDTTKRPITNKVSFVSLLQTGPVILHGPMFSDRSGHFILATGIGVDGSYVVANDPLLGLQVKLSYKSGNIGQITEAYDATSGVWIPFKFANFDRISQISHIEPERFASNFNELCGCVPKPLCQTPMSR